MSINEQIKNYLNSISKTLIRLLLIDIFIIVLIDVHIRNVIPEDCGWHRLVDCFYTLGISYIASFIFYYLQVFVRENDIKKKILPSVERLYRNLLSYEYEIIVDVVSFSNPKVNINSINDVSEKEFVDSFSKIVLSSGSNVYQGSTELSWIQYFSIRQKQIEEIRRVILDYAQYLDNDIISVLAELRDDQLLYVIFPTMILLQNGGTNVQANLSGAVDFAKELFKIIQKCHICYDKLLSPYSDKKAQKIKGMRAGYHKQILT